MMKSLPCRIFLFWGHLFLIFGFIKSVYGAIPSTSTLAKIQHQGRTYLIQKDSDLNLLRVSTDRLVGPIEEELVLKIKRNHLPPRHIHIRLSSTTPESMIYTGIVPSRIVLQGKLRFEIGNSNKSH